MVDVYGMSWTELASSAEVAGEFMEIIRTVAGNLGLEGAIMKRWVEITATFTYPATKEFFL